MDGGHLSAFSSSDDVSILSSSDIEASDIILMACPAWDILVCIFVFLATSKEFLLSCCKIHVDTKGSGHEDDLIVVLSEVEAGLVSVSRKSVDMVDHVVLVGLGWVGHDIGGLSLIDLLQEELALLTLRLTVTSLGLLLFHDWCLV